jgi:hypothetical protein
MKRDDWLGVGLVIGVWLLLMVAMFSQNSVRRNPTGQTPLGDTCTCTCECEEK